MADVMNLADVWPTMHGDLDAMGWAEPLDWTDRRLIKVFRFRLLSDPGHPFMDVSYCYGWTYVGGERRPCRVLLPFDRLPKATWKTALVRYAQRDRVNAKRLGMFEAFSYLS